MAKKNPILFPGWRLSPDGKEYRLFEHEEDMPEGWLRETPGGYAKRKKLYEVPPEKTPDPFDHDGDGKPGGSLPQEKRSLGKKIANAFGDL